MLGVALAWWCIMRERVYVCMCACLQAVFAVAACVWEFLSGKHPIPGYGTSSSTFAKGDVADLPSTTPSGLAAVLRRMLNPDQKDRPSPAAALASVRAVIAADCTLSVPPT